MFTSDFTPAPAANAVGRVLRPDTECRARAREFLVGLIGGLPDDLTWDQTHRLQGHAHLGGRELVVIAPRDDAHSTVVLTTQDWDQVRLTRRRAASLDARRLRHRRPAPARGGPRQSPPDGGRRLNPGLDSEAANMAVLLS